MRGQTFWYIFIESLEAYQMKILTRPLYKLPANFKLKTYSVCLIPFLRNVEKVHFNCLVLLSIMVIFVSLAQLLHDAFLPKSQNLVQNSIETLTLASKMLLSKKLYFHENGNPFQIFYEE